MLITQDNMSYDFAKEIISVVRHPVGWVSVQFEDGPEDMPIQLVLLHLPVWEIYRKLGYSVYKKHIMHDIHSFSKGSFINMLTQAYLEICPNNSQEVTDQFVWAVWETINDVDDFGTIELAEHHCSISLIDLVEIVQDPALKDIINVDMDTSHGTDMVEMRMTAANTKLCKMLGTRGALQNEALLPYAQASILNTNQIPQVLISFGLRTEPNDIIVPRPVQGSALSGMHDIVDLAIEQQGARKAAIMNHEAIKTSQYWGRKMHLLTGTIEKVYMEDCGTPFTVPYFVTAGNYRNFVGKYVEHYDGTLVLLTSKNVKDCIDTTINMRTVMYCRHTDGVCAICGGAVAKNITKGMNLGINSAATLVSEVSQMILSTKHLIKTLSQIYSLPIFAQDVFERKSDGIHLLETYRKINEPWFLGVYFDDIYGSLTDLLEVSDDMNIPEERFSNVQGILIKAPDGQMREISLMVDGQCPFFTIEFLMHIRDKYKDLTVDEDVWWVPMTGIRNLPIFRTSIVNDSMFAYVKSVIKFLENGMLTKHKTGASALEHFSELAWSKVPKINILHLEIILRAHMVVGRGNWNIPVVKDPEKVSFEKTVEISMNRTISGQFALQGHRKQFAFASTYVVPRSRGIFDRNFDLDKSYIVDK